MHVIQSVGAINFEILDDKNGNCQFALPPSATLLDLQTTVSAACGYQHLFDIQLAGETIVPSRCTNNYHLKISEHHWIALTWRILSEIWNIAVGFKISLRVHSIRPTREDIQTYFLLCQMFGGPESNAQDFDWYHFIQQCAESQSCLVTDLCDRFDKLFICDGETLTQIILTNQNLRGIVNLSSLPPTVMLLDLEENALSGIFGLNQLGGKQLRSLKIRRNPLKIDLQPLVRSEVSGNNPFRVLWVMIHQITDSFPETRRKGNFKRMGYRVAQDWINFSILDRIMIGWHHVVITAKQHSKDQPAE